MCDLLRRVVAYPPFTKVLQLLQRRNNLRRPPRAGWDRGNELVAAELAENCRGCLLRFRAGIATEIAILNDSTVRLRSWRNGTTTLWNPYALDPQGPIQPRHLAVSKEGTLTTVSACLDGGDPCDPEQARVLIDAASGTLSFTRLGSVALQVPLDQLVQLHSSKRWSRASLPLANHWGVFGLGDKAGCLNHEGTRLVMWNTDDFRFSPESDPLYQSHPFALIPHRGSKPTLGVFVENMEYQAWDVSSGGETALVMSAESDNLSLYLIAASEPKSVIRAYSDLVGRHELPPLWALGYQQCRWSYYPDREVRAVMDGMIDNGIPCDLIYLDIDYMDGYRCFTWDKEGFPDPSSLQAYAREKGMRLVAMVDPGIKEDPGYTVFDQGMKEGHFLRRSSGDLYIDEVWPGNCAFPDFTNPRARRWWGTLYQQLLDAGVEGFWNDMNEPSTFTSTKTMADDVMHDVEGLGPVCHRHAHNIYGAQMARASAEGIRTLLAPLNRRDFLLTRSGFSGVQRFAWMWTGDNESSWLHLRNSVVKLLQLNISAFPGSGADIGGFRGAPSAELYARWIQLGTFYALSRTHTAKGTPAQEPWSFGEQVTSIARRFIRLRYRLLPYLYTHFVLSCRDGTPFWRTLFCNYPDAPLSYDPRWSQTQFLIGDDLLIAPVLDEGAISRAVYLPEGAWVQLETAAVLEGGQIVAIETGLERIPIFARAGSLLPVAKDIGRNAEETMKTGIRLLSVGQAGDRDHVGMLYTDDGLTLDYKSNDESYRLVRLRFTNGELTYDLLAGAATQQKFAPQDVERLSQSTVLF